MVGQFRAGAPRSLSCPGTIIRLCFLRGKGGGGREQEAWPGRVCVCVHCGLLIVHPRPVRPALVYKHRRPPRPLPPSAPSPPIFFLSLSPSIHSTHIFRRQHQFGHRPSRRQFRPLRLRSSTQSIQPAPPQIHIYQNASQEDRRCHQGEGSRLSPYLPGLSTPHRPLFKCIAI